MKQTLSKVIKIANLLLGLLLAAFMGSQAYRALDANDQADDRPGHFIPAAGGSAPDQDFRQILLGFSFCPGSSGRLFLEQGAPAVDRWLPLPLIRGCSGLCLPL